MLTDIVHLGAGPFNVDFFPSLNDAGFPSIKEGTTIIFMFGILKNKTLEGYRPREAFSDLKILVAAGSANQG